MKKIIGVYSAPRQHWVGDGFPVRSMFSYHSHGKPLSPFLLLDRAGPYYFSPAQSPRGVGQHPHRGFETVTIVYDGEVAHQDSTGEGGVIGPGDVQWMTAGGGILHEEFHSQAFTQTGGTLDMVQLWVNLPASAKMTPAGYQAIADADIPDVTLPKDAGRLRVIAGNYEDDAGPARTFSPMNVWDLRLNDGGEIVLPLADGWTAALVVLHGAVRVNDTASAKAEQLVVLEPEGRNVTLKADSDAVILVLNGEPIDEPVAGYGPFVMNSQAEIQQAMDDFNHGRFGQMHPRKPKGDNL